MILHLIVEALLGVDQLLVLVTEVLRFVSHLLEEHERDHLDRLVQQPLGHAREVGIAVRNEAKYLHVFRDGLYVARAQVDGALNAVCVAIHRPAKPLLVNYAFHRYDDCALSFDWHRRHS